LIDCIIPIRCSKGTINIYFTRHSAGDYLFVSDALYNFVWASLCKESSVDAAVNKLNAAVTEAMNSAVPFGLMRRNKYPSCYSRKLKFYTRKKKYFYRRFKKFKAEYFYNKISFYRKLVNTTIMSDRLERLEFIDENLVTYKAFL
jgi:hypothetical protein